MGASAGGGQHSQEVVTREGEAVKAKSRQETMQGERRGGKGRGPTLEAVDAVDR